MRIAFIIPRFEPHLAGGAEVHCQKVAERVAKKGYQVELLTTCARDHFSWKNYYEPGNKVVNGVTVRRFLVDPNRVTPRFLLIQRKIDHRISINEKEEMMWIADSVRSKRMEDFIAKNKDRYDWFVFMPYLFGTTYWGIQAAKEKSLLIPCLHDEPFAYLDLFKKMFNSVQGIMFNTYPEIDLAKKLYNLPDEKVTMVSLGFEPEGEYNANIFREKYGIRDPFILFAGRREGGKNIDILLNYFRIYKKYNKNNLKLVLLGSGVVNLSTEDRDNIFDLGYVPEDAKRGAFAAATVFCQPSVNESLSIVIMESWIAGRPVIVNAGCAVTKDHCIRSDGGLYFGNYPEFEESINYILNNQNIADKMGMNGQRYVKESFSWDAVLKRFSDSLEKFQK
jgi:glycosyltransferase involved in cell wall biosynthesis